MEVKLPLIKPSQAWTGVKVFCTTRSGGLGQAPYDTLNLGLGAGDEPEVVLANRAILRQNVPGEPFWLKQVHGVQVADADGGWLFHAAALGPRSPCRKAPSAVQGSYRPARPPRAWRLYPMVSNFR